ncbi:MAG: beta-galactosidase, partial [Clostridia bacterium]|nr:beta-galactosidase [Clostridia bacterium]
MERLKKIGKLSLENTEKNRASRIGIGFEKLDRGVFDPEKAYDYVGKLGLQWVRIQSGWARTETEKGVYHFEWLDSIVDNLIQRNLEPWICLCYGNPVYTPHAAPVFGAVGCPPIETEEEREAWRRYVTEVVTRYTGKVRYFEVWNEP